ncbi:MAG: hypothetical protein K8T26_03020 [Lentisphaerae bacterium]|nr:hypothetical protein [Lentisphaerota bacterium]
MSASIHATAPAAAPRGTWLLAAVTAMLALLWLGGKLAAHPVLTALHDGGGPACLASVAARVRALPLPYVLERTDGFLALGMRLGTLLWVLLALFLHPATWRGWVPGGGRRRAVLCVGLLLFLLAPWLSLKLVGLGLAMALAVPGDAAFVIPAATMRLLWYAVFLFAYVCAPYWILPHTFVAQLASLATLMLGGWWWTGLAAGDLPVRAPARASLMAGTALLAAAFHVVPAGAGVPWLGDEDYHLAQIAYLCENMPPVWMVVAVGMLLFIRGQAVGACSRRRAAVLCAVAAMLCGAGYPHLHGALARYPYLLRWLEAAPAQLLFPLPTLFFREAVVRASSVACMMGLGAAVWLAWARRPAPAVFAAVAATTIPALQYFGSQAYLEVPALALLVVAALRAEALMDADAGVVRRDYGWIALVLAAFAKETMLPVMAAYVGCRFWRCAWACRADRVARRLPAPTVDIPSPFLRLLREARLAATLVIPLAVYLAFRSTQDIFRGHPGLWGHVLEVDLWAILAGSLWEQVGVVAVIGVVGSLALRRRATWGLFWLWGWLAAVVVFNMGDIAMYVGYSRYNLMLVPPLLAAGLWWLAGASALTRGLWLTAWLAANLALSPLHADGTRRLYWGTPQADVGERYYPFRDVLQRLKAESPNARLLFAGSTYAYYLNFYFAQLDWHPAYRVAGEPAATDLAAAARLAAEDNRDVIVWLPTREAMPLPAALPGYRLERVFTQAGVALAVYGRNLRTEP